MTVGVLTEGEKVAQDGSGSYSIGSRDWRFWSGAGGVARGRVDH